MEILEVEKQKLKVQIITQIGISTSSKFSGPQKQLNN